MLCDTLLLRLKGIRQHSQDKDAFKRRLIHAMADGVLSPEEIQNLDALREQLGLSDAEVRSLRVEAYHVALHAITADGAVTPEEDAELVRIQNYLGISRQDMDKTKVNLARLRLIAEIRAGNLPTAAVSGLVTQKGEQVHWVEAGSLLEERVVRRRYEGGSSGASFRIAKGASFRVGATRGTLVSDKAVVPVSTGDFIITNRRVIFRGDAKSFACKIEKLLDVSLFSDGIRITDQVGRPKTIRFSNAANADVVGMLIAHVVNNFGT